MENVNNNPQARPIWERQKSRRGHRSAVDRALEAHRQRSQERQERTQSRLNMVKGITNQFFTPPNVAIKPQVHEEQINIEGPATMAPEPEEAQFTNPRPMEAILNEAQLGSSEDTALILVDKEISNPEEGPVDDIPKGSYVDYQV